MLHYETVSPNLLKVLKKLMSYSELSNFRLVGGTAMSLLTGHRISVDIDLFTENAFDSLELERFIRTIYPTAILQFRTSHGLSFEIENVKVDMFNWNVPFIRPFVNEDNLRISALADIAAFKLDAITSRKEMKDYWDIATLLNHFSFAEMVVFYKNKYPYNSTKMVLEALSEYDKVVKIPIKTLGNETWETTCAKVNAALQSYFQEIMTEKQRLIEAKEARIIELIKKKKEK